MLVGESTDFAEGATPHSLALKVLGGELAVVGLCQNKPDGAGNFFKQYGTQAGFSGPQTL